MTSREEALRALEKKIGDKADAYIHTSKSCKTKSDKAYHEVKAAAYREVAEDLRSILATASEQAPVAWLEPDTFVGRSPESFEVVKRKWPGDYEEWFPVYRSPAHTSEARDADFWALERGCAALLDGATWAAMHPEDKRAYRDKLSAAMRQEAGSRE